MAQSTGVKGRGNIQLNPLKTVVLKYTGDSHKWNHMHYRNRDLFDIAVKLLTDFLHLFTLFCVIPWRRLSFCSIYLTLSILNFIRSPHALLSSTHYRAPDACRYSMHLIIMHNIILFRKYTFEDAALIKLAVFDWANLGVEKIRWD